MVSELIEEKLRAAFQPDFLQIDNESHQHHSGLGTESHFRVVIVSGAFSTQTAVVRHRAVYSALKNELERGIHALALHIYTPQEWAARQGLTPTSPACRGGAA